MYSQNAKTRLVDSLLGLSRFSKSLLVMIFDYGLLVFSFWASLSIRSNAIYIPSIESNFLILLAPFIAIPIFFFFGLYRSLIRYSNYQSLVIIMLAVSVYTLFWFLIVLSVGIVEKPIDFLIINWLITTFFAGGVRYSARWFFSAKSQVHSNAVIYGAGASGVQLESAMKHNPEIKIVAFLDDNPKIHGRFIEGIKVFKPSSLSMLIEKNGVSEVLLAIPSISKSQTQKILLSLKEYPVVIRRLPGLTDLAQGKVSVSDLKKINIEDLLRRDVRKPNNELLAQDIEQKSVLITGAGGSIGSELCRQIIKFNPEVMILFEISEFSLYSIEQELLAFGKHDIQLVTILGDVQDRKSLDKAIKLYNIQTIYHAAAYKHVPMVEKNSIAGVRVNIFGTLTCIEAAIAGKVENFVFISTDKAVRPTNIMGATKRFAELLLQDISKKQHKDHANKTRISMVRFGNVLGSSGSVVPLFTRQIKEGGPITVTDPEIIRYFMTINEAAQLVIQAGSMGSNGEIFLLDMGEPIQILQLAKDMVRLSGMTVRSDDNLDGDIEIIFTGLRPGEKLFEELLVDDDALPTKHEQIMIANDKGIESKDFDEYLFNLKTSVLEDDFKEISKIFSQTVDGFNPDR